MPRSFPNAAHRLIMVRLFNDVVAIALCGQRTSLSQGEFKHMPDLFRALFRALNSKIGFLRSGLWNAISKFPSDIGMHKIKILEKSSWVQIFEDNERLLYLLYLIRYFQNAYFQKIDQRFLDTDFPRK